MVATRWVFPPVTTTAELGRTANAEPLTQDVHRRSPADVTRLLGFLVLLVVGFGLATVADETMAGIEVDIAEGATRVSLTVAGLMVAALSVITLALALGTPLMLLLTRRLRTLGLGFLAIVLAAVALDLLRGAVPLRTAALPDGAVTAFETLGEFPPAGLLGSYTAAAVVAGLELPARWRRAVWGLLGVLAIMRVLTAQELPLDIAMAIGVGGVVGCALLLLAGRSVRVASPAAIRAALEQAGLVVEDVEHLRQVPGGWQHRVRTPQGHLLVKVVGEESQQLDAIVRGYRRVRLRDVGDDSRYSSARRAAAVEAMLTTYPTQWGVRTPAVRAVVPLHGEDVLVAVQEITGTAVGDLDSAAITDDVLEQCWTQVAGLRAAHVAHRGLDLDSFVLDPQGAVWLTGFDFGQPAAEEHVLAGDVAEVLAATYIRVGAERAVAAALAVLGPRSLEQAVSRLVPAALTPGTRAGLKATEDGAEPLIAEVCRVSGVVAPSLAKIERLQPRYLVMGVLFAVAIYVLLPQLADFPEMVQTIADANWRWVPWVLLASALTYVGVALGLAGATPGRVSAAEYSGLSLASSFVATFAPPGVGHLGLNLRYLQKRGFAGPLAVSILAAKEVVTFGMHVVLLGVFALWAGRSGALEEELKRLPPVGVLVAVGGGVLALLGMALLVPRVRLVVRQTVIPAIRHSVEAMKEVARSPAKMAMLVVGVSLLSLGYGACLYFAVNAFGAQASFAAVALVSLTAGSVASAAPTPGGLGAVEAILLAALVAIGVASPMALAGVFLYRVATFWLPILPGFLAFRWLGARGAI